MKKILSITLFTLLTACNGQTLITSVTAFPVNAAYTNMVKTGSNNVFSFTIATCVGSATTTVTPANPNTFNSVTGFETVQTTTLISSNCTISPDTFINKYEYGPDYSIIGAILGNAYGVAQAPVIIPQTAKVGTSGLLGTLNLYSDISKTTLTGTATIEYSMTADTSTTALLNITTKSYDTSSNLITTEIDSMVIDSVGVLSYKKVDILTNLGIHIVLTK